MGDGPLCISVEVILIAFIGEGNPAHFRCYHSLGRGMAEASCALACTHSLLLSSDCERSAKSCCLDLPAGMYYDLNHGLK